MATAVFHDPAKGTASSSTQTLTPNSGGQTATLAVRGPIQVHSNGQIVRSVYAQQTAGVYRHVGYEIMPPGTALTTTWVCQD